MPLEVSPNAKPHSHANKTAVIGYHGNHSVLLNFMVKYSLKVPDGRWADKGLI